ncbi:PDZ domain-containing protein [Clostridium arbusti]|uniref:PDZ domain-containing protein n=1 Tax=Clostridium arbusti TaxID=1137848 RepID=UPI0002886C02|nr:PDZ domain-containing protein [Clostridium arbusti]
MNIALYVFRSISQAIITPPYIFILLILVFILYTRNKKTVIMQKMIIGEKMNSSLELTISQVVLGIFAGTIASLILSYLGIVFTSQTTVTLLFMISIILMIFGSRFICFSYSAGILALISVAIQFIEGVYHIPIPQLDFLKVDVVMIISLVAVLHIIEGLLVIIDGDRGTIPVFTNKNNRIIGGFALKRYWVMPVALMFIMNNPNISYSAQVPIQNWWPIIKFSSHDLIRDAFIGFFAFYGMIGYNAITFTRTKKQKVISSGIGISVYGLILLLFAQIGRINLAAEFIVAIFTPLAHEIMLKIQTYIEVNGKPKYVSSDNGLMVLEVAPASPAFEMGIKSGDLLIEVNDKKIVNEQDMLDVLNTVSNFIWFKIKTVHGKLEQVDYNKMNRNKRLGIVFVPRIIPKDSVVMKLDRSSFQDTLEKAKKDKKDKK